MGNHTIDCKYCHEDIRAMSVTSVKAHEDHCAYNPANREEHTVTLESGNFLTITVNTKRKQLVIDLIHGNQEGGNEIIRTLFDQEKLLEHVR